MTPANRKDMDSTADRFDFSPPQGVRWHAPLTLALLIHGLLVMALTWGIHWQNETQVVMEAELWSSLPQVAAPRASAPVPAPPEPEPAPPPQRQPAPPAPPPAAVQDREQADIALQKKKEADKRRREAALLAQRETEARQRAEDQKKEDTRKKREAEKAAEAKKQDALRKKRETEAAEQKKREAEQAREREREKAKQDKVKQDKAAKDKADREKAEQAKTEQKKKDEQRKAEEARRDAQLEADRKKNLERMMGMAGASGATGGGSGNAASKGSSQVSSGPSANYAGKLVAAIKANYNAPEELPAGLEAVAEISVLPDGTIISHKLVKSSGNAKFDKTVSRAIELTARLPKDENGKIPERVFEIRFKP